MLLMYLGNCTEGLLNSVSFMYVYISTLSTYQMIKISKVPVLFFDIKRQNCFNTRVNVPHYVNPVYMYGVIAVVAHLCFHSLLSKHPWAFKDNMQFWPVWALTQDINSMHMEAAALTP